MIKRISIIVVLLLLLGCEKPGDCIKSSGPMRSRTYSELVFSKILVNKGIAVVIKEGPEYSVQVTAGENLINDIKVEVVGDLLELTDDTTCNWTREYGQTIVYVTTPNLTDLYCKTEKTIASDGVLHFPSLRLIAMDTFDGYDGVGTGDLILNIDNESLTVESNNVSGFFLVGHTESMFVNYYESGGILHGEHLIAQDVEVFHRGTNNVILHPIHSIKGGIFNTGDVICYNRPELPEEVVEYYRGRLIFIQ
jgi:hypothetical protein